MVSMTLPDARVARRTGVSGPFTVGALAWVGAAATVAAALDGGSVPVTVVGLAAAVGATAVLASRRRPGPAAALALLAAVHGVLAWTEAAQPLALAAWLVLGLSLAVGRSAGTRRAIALVAGAVALAWSGWLAFVAADPRPGGPGIAVAAAAVAVTAGLWALAACRRAAPADRRLLQWATAGAVLAAAVAGVAAVLHTLIGVPDQPGAVALTGLALVPLGVAAGAGRRTARHAETALTEAVVGAGMAIFVGAVYLVVVIGLGRVPAEAERQLLGLSLAAAAVVAVLALPVRGRLLEVTGRLLGQSGTSPADVVSGFGARMTRAVPMDELLLQLAESLRDTLGPSGAEIWVGDDDGLDRTVSVPDRPAARILLAERELAVAGRARVVGNAWLAVWAPALLEGRAGQLVRVAPIAHLGQLLGLIVVARPEDAGPYGEDDDRTLSGLARQVGLALHNVQLDSALEKSLDEVRRRNAELVASRARVVAAADESRRRIERNLHDGAQQHLVALAVKLGLADQLLDDRAVAGELIGELRADVRAAISSLRELAHGIYPPLLRERGLSDALATAATRCPLPTETDIDLDRRFPQEVETAVYFCCLEALQNAGKYAGADATVTIEVHADADSVRFSVSDTGAGFDTAGFDIEAVGGGAGFVNMADRLGAIGGTLDVRSAPGAGTTISGTVPAAPAAQPA
ncbi:MAG TPA: histidine kinase [Mycobacteriales bacterium]